MHLFGWSAWNAKYNITVSGLKDYTKIAANLISLAAHDIRSK